MTVETYFIELKIVKSTPASAPVTTSGNASYPSLLIPEGSLLSVMPLFPSTSNFKVAAQLLLNGHVIFPEASNINGYISFDLMNSVQFSTTRRLNMKQSYIDIVGYNLDATNDWVIGFAIELDVTGADS